MDKIQVTCDDHSNTGRIKKNKCYENDFLSLDIDDTNSHYQTEIKYDPVFVVAFTVAFIQLFWDNAQSKSHYPSYDSPPLIRSVQALFQVFII